MSVPVLSAGRSQHGFFRCEGSKLMGTPAMLFNGTVYAIEDETASKVRSRMNATDFEKETLCNASID
jgi:hypothetical protein